MDEENPFADPGQVNPFMDPSVMQVSAQSTTVVAGLDDPFGAPSEPATVSVAPVITQPPAQITQPAVGPVSSAGYGAGYGAPAPPTSSYGGAGYGSGAASFNSQPPKHYGNEETMHKQKLVENEFRKREEDLERRERQLRDEQKRLEEARVYGDRVPNFPPLPKFFPCTPCVYHNIDFDIAPEHQLNVKRCFYHWQFTVICYLLNFIVCFGMICALGTKAGSAFGLSLLYAGLFIPLSFLTWYRMLYNAVRLDSSMRYMLFFFMYGFQIFVSGIGALGFNSGGFAGWITAFKTMEDNKALGVLGILVSLAWCANCLIAVYLIMQIHKTYRTTGQSMEKASGEFAASAGSNRNVAQAVLRSL